MGRGGAIVGLNVVQRRVSTGDIDIPEELGGSKEAGKDNEDALARSVVGRRSTMLLNAKAGGGAHPCIFHVIGNTLSSTPRKVKVTNAVRLNLPRFA